MGNNLKQFRTERGMTLADLGAEVGLAVSTLSKLENGIIPVSDATREIFTEGYPHYDFAFGKPNSPRLMADKYKERIEGLKVDIADLKKENKELKEHLDMLYRKLFNVEKVLSADVASVRVYSKRIIYKGGVIL